MTSPTDREQAAEAAAALLREAHAALQKADTDGLDTRLVRDAVDAVNSAISILEEAL